MKKMKPNYLISTGIVPLLENRFSLKLEETTKANIRQSENDFVEQIEETLTQFNIIKIQDYEIENDMRERVSNSENELPLVSLDDVYFSKLNSETLSITRLHNDVDNLSDMEIGPRGLFPSLEYQIQNLKNKYNSSEIGIIDVGIFHGDTLIGSDSKKGLVDLFTQNGLVPKKVYLGIANQVGYNKLQETSLEVSISEDKIFNLNGGDWLEVRDLLAFDGRKINRIKYDLPDSTQVFMKYTGNGETLSSWAGITNTRDQQKILALSEIARNDIFDVLIKDGFQIQEGYLNGNKKIYTLDIK